MELKQIKELMAAMGRTGIKKLSLKKEGFELQLEREENGIYKQIDTSLEGTEENHFRTEATLRRPNVVLARGSEMPSLGAAASPTAPSAPPTQAPKEDLISIYVTSPMVGTFYSYPTPEDPPFVKVGDKVEKNTVVCIVEAMKVMNEVKAGVTGTVVEILVENGHPVEFGTKLYRITP